jgi:hypothetical protein
LRFQDFFQPKISSKWHIIATPWLRNCGENYTGSQESNASRIGVEASLWYIFVVKSLGMTFRKYAAVHIMTGMIAVQNADDGGQRIAAFTRGSDMSVACWLWRKLSYRLERFSLIRRVE